jgi:hypothetical protein
MSRDPSDKDHSNDAPSKSNAKKTEQSQSENVNSSMPNSTLSSLTEKQRGVFTAYHLSSAGFEYTGEGDAARCKACGLEISNWTMEMNPYKMHLEQKPDCSFIQSTTTSSLSNELASSSLATTIRNTSASNENLPSVDDLVRAGFFPLGTKSIFISF